MKQHTFRKLVHTAMFSQFGGFKMSRSCSQPLVFGYVLQGNHKLMLPCSHCHHTQACRHIGKFKGRPHGLICSHFSEGADDDPIKLIFFNLRCLNPALFHLHICFHSDLRSIKELTGSLGLWLQPPYKALCSESMNGMKGDTLGLKVKLWTTEIHQIAGPLSTTTTSQSLRDFPPRNHQQGVEVTEPTTYFLGSRSKKEKHHLK